MISCQLAGCVDLSCLLYVTHLTHTFPCAAKSRQRAHLGFVGNDEELGGAGGHVGGKLRRAVHVERRVNLVAEKPRRAQRAVDREGQRERRERLLAARELRERLPRPCVRPASW